MSEYRIILSAELSECSTHENEQRTSELRGRLHSLLVGNLIAGYRQVQGCYKGSVEQSYLVTLRDDGLNMGISLALLAKEYEQESILMIRPTGTTTLIFMNGDVCELGYWQPIELVSGYGKMPDSYTIDGGVAYHAAAKPVAVPFDQWEHKRKYEVLT